MHRPGCARVGGTDARGWAVRMRAGGRMMSLNRGLSGWGGGGRQGECREGAGKGEGGRPVDMNSGGT